MRLTVTTNWADDFIGSTAEFKEIEWITGRLYKDEVGGQIPVVNFSKYPTRKKIEKSISQIHSVKKKFCYVLDGHCLENKEYTWEGQKKILDFLKWIENSGADAVSVAIPYLVEVLKEQFPRLKIDCGISGMVGEMQRVKYLDKLGVDSISLISDVNRNFQFLKAFKKAVKCKLKLTVNSTCLYHCNFRCDHINMLSHTSNFTTKSKYSRYYNYVCNKAFLDDPQEILKSGFIRPEDTESYESLGYEDFILDLNSVNTEDIVSIIRAYTARKFKGNLLELMSLKGERLFQDVNGPLFNLDNNKLNGFLERFTQDDSGACYYEACGLDCNYCKRKSESAIYCADKNKAAKLKVFFQKRIEDIENGIYKNSGQV